MHRPENSRFVSTCCGCAISVRWTGWPQFAREGTTHWYVCTKCWEPTDRVLKPADIEERTEK